MKTDEGKLPSRRAMLALGVVGVAAAGLGAYAAIGVARRSDVPPNIPGLLWPNPKRLEPFSLVDQDGQAFGVAQLQGHWNLVFFGYTYCPDVCPLTLQAIKSAKVKLAELGTPVDDLQAVLVSVDPQRDTPARLKSYVGFFGEEFVGVSGEEPRLSDFAAQLGVIYVRGEDDGAGGYLIDHTATVLVVDPDVQLVGPLYAPHEPERMAVEFRSIRSFVTSQS
ncbi:MAG: SCO family protein [Gammaproteobacteria bacterium]